MKTDQLDRFGKGKNEEDKLGKYLVHDTTSFKDLTTDASWERGKLLQKNLGINRPTREQGMNIK